MQPSVTRRNFFASVAGATVAALGAAPAPAEDANVYDVAVIGAGLSGLTAARDLVRAGMGNVIVLEARDRVGGRTVNHDIGGGHVVEGGGQWVGPTQTALLDLCKELNVETFPTFLAGNAVAIMNGRRLVLSGKLVLAEDQTPLIRLINELARQVPLNAPWSAPQAAEWDAMTVADWLKQNNPAASDREVCNSIAALDLSTTVDQLSFLYFLYYIHSAGSVRDLQAFEGGAQERRIAGGSQILSLLQAKELGDRVKLGHPVERVLHDDTGVTIASGKATFRARCAIFALTPSLCDRIQFEPALPAVRVALQQKWVQRGSAVKYNVVYAKPFWREQGLSGLSISDTSPVVPFTTDNSPPDAALGVILILTSREGLAGTIEARRKQVLDELSDRFGEAAREAIAVHEMDWSAEKFTAECVSPLAPGVLTQYGQALRPPVGRIHWAGTETAEVWTGYMDGAVRAGHAAAKAAQAQLI